MTAWDVSSRLLLAITLAAVGCYDVPKPDCGFRCGPNLECPEDYSCKDDGRCHLNGSSQSVVCPSPDAGPTPDAYSPNVVSSSPAAGASVNPSSNVQVVFDVDVTGVTNSSFTVGITGTTTPLLGNIAYDPVLRTATFSTPDGLPPNQDLTATLTSDIFDPLSGRALMPTTIPFHTTADTTPPMVVFTNPSNGTSGLSVAANITFHFSETVSNANGATVTLIETASMTAVAGAVTYDAVGRTTTFNPTDQLTPNLGYTGRLTGITDNTSNNLTPNPFLSTFQTGNDNVVPSVRTTAPLPNATAVAVNANIIVTFDEPVVNVTTTTFQLGGGAIAGTVTMSNGNRIATFDPTANLPAATAINVTLSTAILDTSGNPLPATSFAFTTL